MSQIAAYQLSPAAKVLIGQPGVEVAAIMLYYPLGKDKVDANGRMLRLITYRRPDGSILREEIQLTGYRLRASAGDIKHKQQVLLIFTQLVDDEDQPVPNGSWMPDELRTRGW